MSDNLTSIAQRWLQAGWSVLPVKNDKRPLASWKHLQTQPYALNAVEAAFKGAHAVAAICGYGGLYAFDFDQDKKNRAKEPFNLERDFYHPWRDTAEALLNVKLQVQTTPSGGYHVPIVVPTPLGNTKLARVPTKDGDPHATIETRGEGGYIVIYNGQIDPTRIPNVTDAEYQKLLEAALTLDRVTDDFTPTAAPATPQRAASATTEGDIGWWNEHVSLREVLERNGYRRVHHKYISPTSSSGNAGVSIFKDENGLELCFSHHGDALSDGHAHDSFSAMRILEAGGDFRAALEVVRRARGEVRFTFGASRAREVSDELSTNKRNPVQDGNDYLCSDVSTNEHKSTNNPDLGSFVLKGEHKQTTPSRTQKPDLCSDTDTPRENTKQKDTLLIQRWGARPTPPPVQWLVHNLIQDNAENLIAGEPGVGKSWISGDLSVSIATGTPFLGRQTKQGAVVVINFDDPSESLPRMFAERSANAKDYAFNELPIYYWQPPEDKPYPPNGVITDDIFENLRADLLNINPRLIIIDAYTSAFPTLDGNKGQDVIVALEALRQLRVASGKPCATLLVDHTPKATLMDSKRRGVSGSQQKHAKVRTVHIIRKIDPSEVGGDDVLSWEIFKANAAPYQEPFGIDREMDSIMQTATLTQRDVPISGKAASTNRAVRAAIATLKANPNTPMSRQDLMTRIIELTGSSKASARRALEDNEFLDQPSLKQVELGGRGNPIGFVWEAEIDEEEEILTTELEKRVKAGTWRGPNPDALKDAFHRARAGDEDAQEAIRSYLQHQSVRQELKEGAAA